MKDKDKVKQLNDAISEARFLIEELKIKLLLGLSNKDTIHLLATVETELSSVVRRDGCGG